MAVLEKYPYKTEWYSVGGDNRCTSVPAQYRLSMVDNVSFPTVVLQIRESSGIFLNRESCGGFNPPVTALYRPW